MGYQTFAGLCPYFWQGDDRIVRICEPDCRSKYNYFEEICPEANGANVGFANTTLILDSYNGTVARENGTYIV